MQLHWRPDRPIGRRPIDSAQSTLTIPSKSRDPPVRRHQPDPPVPRVGYVQVPIPIDGDSAGILQPSRRRFPVVSIVTRGVFRLMGQMMSNA